MTTEQHPPADWYPDPYSPGVLRYWDGSAWTAHTAPGEAPAAAAVYPGSIRLSPGVGTNTVWFWLIILLPLALSILDLLIPLPASQTATISSLTDPTTGPAPLSAYDAYATFSNLTGLVVYGLNVIFAYLDYAALRNRGIDRPFHWAWQFLSPVYLIGRIVVAIRRTGSGWGLLWAFIIATVATYAITVFMVAQAIGFIANTSLQLISDLPT